MLAALGLALSDWTASIRTTMERTLCQSGVARPAIEAAALFATIDGVAQHYVLDPEHYPLDAAIETLTLRYA